MVPKGSEPAERLHWVDTAKAVAVVLVVVYHVSLNGLLNIAPGGPYFEQPWGVASMWLLPLRMPLFFLISGVLAVKALRRPWSRVLRPRVLGHWWTFTLWTAAVSVFYALAYAPQAIVEVTLRVLSWIPTASGYYWYLPLLAFFFITAKALHRLPWIAVALGVAAYLIAPQLPRDTGSLMGNNAMLSLIRYSQFLLWFMLGAFARPVVLWAARAKLPVVIIAAALYVPGVILTQSGGPNLTPWLSVIGIVAVLGSSRMVSSVAGIRRLGRYLAERTLPIYLVHPFALTLIALVLPALPALRTRYTLILVPLVVIGLVTLSCLLYDRTRDRLPWLYRLPGFGLRRSAVEHQPEEAASHLRPADGPVRIDRMSARER